MDIKALRKSFYILISKRLADYERGYGCSGEDLYRLLLSIQSNWDELTEGEE